MVGEKVGVPRSIRVLATFFGALVTSLCALWLILAHMYLLLMLWGKLFAGSEFGPSYLGVFKLLFTHVVMVFVIASIVWPQQVSIRVPIVLAVVSGGLSGLCYVRGVFAGDEEWLLVDGLAPFAIALLVALRRTIEVGESFKPRQDDPSR